MSVYILDFVFVTIAVAAFAATGAYLVACDNL
jgi:hypothetical protein